MTLLSCIEDLEEGFAITNLELDHSFRLVSRLSLSLSTPSCINHYAFLLHIFPSIKASN